MKSDQESKEQISTIQSMTPKRNDTEENGGYLQ
jgi:hypothetical protein